MARIGSGEPGTVSPEQIVMVPISSRDLLLLLIGVDAPQGSLDAITRIQRLLYLLDVEEHIRPGLNRDEFIAYTVGPYSPQIYNDLEFLQNLNLIRKVGTEPQNIEPEGQEPTLSISPEASEPEGVEIDLTSDAPTADAYEETRYSLTSKGEARIQQLLATKQYQPVVDGIRRVKSRFAKYLENWEDAADLGAQKPS